MIGVKIYNHFRKHPIPINWASRIDKFKPSKGVVAKHDWCIWRKMEARRSQNAAYNSCTNRTEILKGKWAKIYH
jgi:hypothetical protein